MVEIHQDDYSKGTLCVSIGVSALVLVPEEAKIEDLSPSP